MTKKKFIKIFVCAAMVFLMAVGIGLPVIVSADTKSDYRQAQDKLNQIKQQYDIKIISNLGFKYNRVR